MADQVLINILDHVIRHLENRKEQQITEFIAAHAGSSLSSPEEAEEDPEIRWTLFAIDEITALRKKVLEGDAPKHP